MVGHVWLRSATCANARRYPSCRRDRHIALVDPDRVWQQTGSGIAVAVPHRKKATVDNHSRPPGPPGLVWANCFKAIVQAVSVMAED